MRDDAVLRRALPLGRGLGRTQAEERKGWRYCGMMSETCSTAVAVASEEDKID